MFCWAGLEKGPTQHNLSVHTFNFSLFLIVICELLENLLVLIRKILCVVTVINLDACLKLCCVVSLNLRELGRESDV